MSAGPGVGWILPPSPWKCSIGRDWIGIEWVSVVPFDHPPSPDDFSEYTSLCHFSYLIVCAWVLLNLDDIPLFWPAYA